MSTELDVKKIYTTAIGTAVWPKLIEPEVKFNPDGVFTTRQRFQPEDEAQLIEELTALYEQAYIDNCKEQKKTKLKKSDLPWKPEVTKDEEGNETETGRMLFTFKMNHKGKNKQGKVYTQKPGIFDGQGASLNGVADLNIGGGSELIVAYTVRGFYTATIGSGISLKLKSVQIAKLVSFGERTASDYGFKPIAGAYSSAPKATAQQEDEAEASGEATSDESEDF